MEAKREKQNPAKSACFVNVLYGALFFLFPPSAIYGVGVIALSGFGCASPLGDFR